MPFMRVCPIRNLTIFYFRGYLLRETYFISLTRAWLIIYNSEIVQGKDITINE